MEIINAITVSLAKYGMEHLILMFILLFINILLYLGVRRLNAILRVVLDRVNNNYKELDPSHLYSKLNRFETDLEVHQSEETRQHNDIGLTVHKIDNTTNRIEAVMLSSLGRSKIGGNGDE